MNFRGLLGVAAALAVTPMLANANYTAQCDALISKWKQCGGDLGACTIVELAIMQQCKCHQFDEAANEWELIGVQNAPDGVCGQFEPTTGEPGDTKKPIWTFQPKPGQGLKPGIVLSVPKIGAESAEDAAGGAAEGAAIVGGAGN